MQATPSSTVCEQCGALCAADATICFACGAPIGEVSLDTGPLAVPDHLKAPITVELPAIPRSAAPPAAERARCPACGYPLEPDASICFECGAPIGDDSRDTGPLHVPDHLRAPITIELPVVIWTERARRAHELAAPDEPATAAATKPSKRAARAVRVNAAARARRPITRRDLIVAGIILLVTLLLVAAGIEVLVQYRVAPPAVPTQTIYRDPAQHFHFMRPTLWQPIPTTDGVALADADATSTLHVAAVPAWGLTASQQADALATALGLAKLPPVQIAGQSWEQRAGQVREPNGVQREIVALVTVHESILYTIQYASPISSFADLTLLVYQPLLQSFAFDSPAPTPTPRLTPAVSATPSA